MGVATGKGSPVYTLFIVNRRAATSKGKASSSYNLSVSLLLDTSPSRGGLGIAVQFVRFTAAASHTTKPKRGGTPEAPLLGKTPSGRREMSRMRQRVDDWQSRQALTERLYGRLTFPLQAASTGLSPPFFAKPPPLFLLYSPQRGRGISAR